MKSAKVEAYREWELDLDEEGVASMGLGLGPVMVGANYVRMVVDIIGAAEGSESTATEDESEEEHVDEQEPEALDLIGAGKDDEGADAEDAAAEECGDTEKVVEEGSIDAGDFEATDTDCAERKHVGGKEPVPVGLVDSGEGPAGTDAEEDDVVEALDIEWCKKRQKERHHAWPDGPPDDGISDIDCMEREEDHFNSDIGRMEEEEDYLSEEGDEEGEVTDAELVTAAAHFKDRYPKLADGIAGTLLYLASGGLDEETIIEVTSEKYLRRDDEKELIVDAFVFIQIFLTLMDRQRTRSESEQDK